MQPASALISAANAANPTIGDQAAALNLSHTVKIMSNALAELRSATSKSEEAYGSLEIDSALDQLVTLDTELVEVKRSAQQGQLRPLPGETVSLYICFVDKNDLNLLHNFLILMLLTPESTMCLIFFLLLQLITINIKNNHL